MTEAQAMRNLRNALRTMARARNTLDLARYERANAVKALYGLDWSAAAIAGLTGLTVSRVYQILNRG